MVFTVEADDGDVVAWELTDEGAVPVRDPEWAPSLYVSGPDERLAAVERWAEGDSGVVATGREAWRLSLRDDERSEVLRVDGADPRGVERLARRIRQVHERRVGRAPGTLRFFDADLDLGTRYCLDAGADPTPDRDLRRVDLALPEPARVAADASELLFDGESLGDGGDEAAALRELDARLRDRDPDVLVVDGADLVPTVLDRADALDVDCSLGRAPGYDRIAGENSYVSYGTVRRSPARYAVPGRAIVDASTSFLWAKSSLAGLLDMVTRAQRPLQETAWASIGTVLTAVQIREARRRGILAPWNKWDPEEFTDLRTLHAADRGGHTVEPRVGHHVDVHELDFASLYPTIIRDHNVSPETVDCDCCDGDDVPDLGYSICEEDGFLGDVLDPLIEDRADYKEEAAAAAAAGDETVAADYRARAGAIKWVLVACFGFLGYRNAKFGRIECHQAINAIARDLLLTAKDEVEDAGWEVLHGIVDSIWVTPRVDDPTPIDEVADAVTERVGIRLEHESRFDWLCFCPTREGRGALNRYFGRRATGDVGEADDGDEDGGSDGAAGERYKLRGIECRQRSTPAFVAGVQRDLLGAVDRTGDPEPVCERLRRACRRLDAGDVAPADLVITTRASKPPAEYSRDTLTAAALARAERLGFDRAAGQDVRYVVVDDAADGARRVCLAAENPAPEDVDREFYRRLLVRAAESVTAPLGWDRVRVERYLRSERAPTLSAFR